MKIISFVSQKGGAGKSTLAANIAAYFDSLGHKAAIVDLDPQASISAWFDLRGHNNKYIELVPSHPPLLKKQIEKLKKAGYKVCLIDTPPHNSTAAANAVDVSNLTVIPVRPAAFDLSAAQATFDLIRKSNVKGGVVLNAVPPNTNVKTPASEFVQSCGITVIGTIGQRIDFQHAVNNGQGITEFKPKSTAAKEIISLVYNIAKFEKE